MHQDSRFVNIELFITLLKYKYYYEKAQQKENFKTRRQKTRSAAKEYHYFETWPFSVEHFKFLAYACLHTVRLYFVSMCCKYLHVQ